jgi:hypothetical protein
MKKILFFPLILVLLALPLKIEAGTYPTGQFDDTPLKAGNCTMVNTEAEKSVTTVYTLNPDHTRSLAYQYRNVWHREARCDELQFHVDHNTTINCLRLWLIEVEKERYRNMGTSIYNGQTMSTPRYDWFLIKDGKRYHIPDLPTAYAWGLLVQDRISVSSFLTDYFYEHVEDGGALNYTDGQYFEQIDDVWRNLNFSQSTFPTRLQEELETQFSQNAFTYINPCSIDLYIRGAYCKLLDFGWTSQNSETYVYR